MWGEEGVGGGGVLLEMNDTNLVQMERIVEGSDRVGLSEGKTVVPAFKISFVKGTKRRSTEGKIGT